MQPVPIMCVYIWNEDRSIPANLRSELKMTFDIHRHERLKSYFCTTYINIDMFCKMQKNKKKFIQQTNIFPICYYILNRVYRALPCIVAMWHLPRSLLFRIHE